MKKTKHTPGVWSSEPTATINQRHIVTINDIDGHPIADVRYKLHATQAENLSNAKLIAAAPELLEALKYAYEVRQQTHHGSDKLLNLLKSAIKKATT